MTFQLLDLPLIFGGIYSFGLAIRFLIRPGDNRLGNYLMAGVLFVGSWQLWVFSLMYSKNITHFPHLALTGFPMEFLAGPLYYLYSSITFRGKKRLRWRDGLHLIPFIFGVHYFSEFYMMGTERKVRILERFSDPDPGPLSLGILLIFVSIFLSKAFYIFLFQRNLRRFSQSVLDRTSNSLITENFENYRVITYWFLGYAALFAALVIGVSYWHVYGIYIDYSWYALKSTFMFAFAFFALKQRKQSIDEFPITAASLQTEAIEFSATVGKGLLKDDEVVEPSEVKGKYANSGLSDSMIESMEARLEQFMTDEQPYLNSELSLVSLANQLGAHPNHLSQVINQRFGESFSSYVNSYRIKYAQSSLSDSNVEDTILEIAFSSGFNSKASFNRIFKKTTSMTPTQFRRARQKAVSQG